MQGGRKIKFIISTEAQNHFGRLLDDVAANGTRYIVKRFCAPKAAIISLEDLETLLAGESNGQTYLQVLQESRPTYTLGEPSEPRSAGRD
jgi:hypothetical protein